MLVRRHSEAAGRDWHGLHAQILMDAGELGSRHMTAVWIEVPAGTSQQLRTHEDSEQVYVVVSGSASLSAAGDTEELGAGDLAMISPATDYEIANDGEGPAALLSVCSPAVSVDELLTDRREAVAGFDDDEY